MQKQRYSEPAWWTVQHTVIWERYLPALQRDFQLRYVGDERSRAKNLGPDDALFQREPAPPRNVDVEHAHQVPDASWETGGWDEIAPAVRWGVGARVEYPTFGAWSEALESRLREDWSRANEPGTWERAKRAVRHGFESIGKGVS